jgi:hypothetical protein
VGKYIVSRVLIVEIDEGRAQKGNIFAFGPGELVGKRIERCDDKDLDG